MSMLDNMLEAITSAYNSKPSGRIGKLFSLLAGSLDDLDRTFSMIREWHDVDRARGRTLDLMGRNFGVAREGMPDQFLRLLIKVKMAARLSGGDIDTVINAVASLYEIEPEQLTLTEIFPAKIQVTSAPNALTEEQIAMGLFYHKFIKRIIAAGVGLIIVMQTETPMPDIQLGVKPVAMLGSMSSTTLPWVDFGHEFERRVVVVPQVASLSSITMPENWEAGHRTEEDKAQYHAAVDILESGKVVIDPDDYPVEMMAGGPVETHSGTVINYHINPQTKSYDAPCGLPRECVWYKCPDHPGYTHKGPCPLLLAKETEVS